MAEGKHKPAPLVSVVVPNLNGGSVVLRCLESVATQSYQQLEMILVDNASTDGSHIKATEAFPTLRLVTNQRNHGFALACNQGAAVSRAPYLLFVNSDASLERDALSKMVCTMEEGRYQVIQPVILGADGSVDSAGDLFMWTGFLWHQREPLAAKEAFPVFAVKGACMLVQRGTFERLRGFNESYFAYFEEADLCWRARLLGYEVGVEPLATVQHEGGRTTRRIFRPGEIYHLCFRNRLRSILANPSLWSLLSILPLHMFGCFCTSAAFAIRGQISEAAGILKAVAWPLINVQEVLSQRRSAQTSRKVPDTEVFRRDLTMTISPGRVLTLLTGTLPRWQRTKKL